MKILKTTLGALLVIVGVAILVMSLSGCGDMTETGSNTVGTTPVDQSQSATAAQPAQQEEQKPEPPATQYRITAIGGNSWLTEDISEHHDTYIQFKVNDKTITVHGNFIVEEL